MSATHEVIRYGANSIRGYVGDVPHFEINPHGLGLLDTDITGNLSWTNWTSDSGAAKVAGYKIWRLGSIRFLSVAAPSLGTTAAAKIVSTALPAIDRPATIIQINVPIVMENLWMVGFASLGTDGVITVGAASPHTSGGTVFQEYNEFAAVTNSGFSTPFMFVYTVASPLATW